MSLLFILASLATAQDYGGGGNPDSNVDTGSGPDRAGTASGAYLDSNIYRPPIETDGMLWTEDAGIEPDGLTHVSLQTNYIFDPETFTSPDNDFDSASQALRTDLIGAAAVRGVQIGVDVPMYVIDDNDLFDGRVGLGDLALDVKGGLVEAGEDNPVNVGAGLNVQLPTTADNINRSGVDSVAWEARVVADGEINDQLKLAGNVGTRGLPDEVVDTDGFENQFFFRAGAGYDIVEDAGLSLDVIGALDYDRPIADLDAPVQGLLGAYGIIDEQFMIQGGVGSGLLPGVYGPHTRAMLGVSWMPSESMDRDIDAVGANVDQCPGQAEDMDGFEDEDGCPDADNDRDNVADLTDQCPDEAEDLDGLKDNDGCSDKENRVSVRIRDDRGMAMTNADVTIEKEGRIIHQGKGTLDAELEPGVYTLTANSPGFEPVKTSFRVYPDDVVQISATLTKGLSPSERGNLEGQPMREDVDVEHRDHLEDVDIERDIEQPIDEGLEEVDEEVEEVEDEIEDPTIERDY